MSDPLPTTLQIRGAVIGYLVELSAGGDNLIPDQQSIDRLRVNLFNWVIHRVSRFIDGVDNLPVAAIREAIENGLSRWAGWDDR